MTALAIATFADEGAYLRARTRLMADERRIVGEWLPYASEALGEGDVQRGIRGGAIVVGVLGALALFALTTWSAVWAYPFDSGGRPLFSWQAFLPAPIEFGALFAAVGGAIVFGVRARLTRLHDGAFFLDEVARASTDAFVVAVACDAGEDANAVLATLAAVGATHTRLAT